MRLLVAGGGTGGHLYPGIAIAEEVTARPSGAVLFVGTARGLETKLVPAAGFELQLLDVSGLNRVGIGNVVKGLVRLPKAFFASRAVLKRFRPDLVIGVGGYASGPLVLAAALLGYPTAIQEQNSQAGFTNRVLGLVVRRVFVAFEDARRFFTASKTVLTGNPVRRKFVTAFDAGTAEAEAPNVLGTVLILGGSQGARAVNDLVVAAAAVLAKQGRLPRLVHQTGAGDEARIRQSYEAAGLTGRVEIRPFIDDMPAALGAAALVVGRAGALTLAELAMTGRPAILIPLPTAAADHQTRNAAEFERAGAALVAAQGTTTAASLATLIADLIEAPARRAEMSRHMAALGRPNATRDIVDELEKLVAAR
ncbi:MAG TPA: undecaprenyldiphospho-muramoylpentapeptide beta-N-acetylglucosaminyltransferase [Polyangia bacterium]|jgi:UDP-N-acetylglucosamine--N-acetylmuramyl-(pentapeptide) pyrophosphoryl-undecaprenol N-acetylglucosamine transferase